MLSTYLELVLRVFKRPQFLGHDWTTFGGAGEISNGTLRGVHMQPHARFLLLVIVVGAVASSSGRPVFPSSVEPPSLASIDQTTQAALVSDVLPGFQVELWAGDSTGLALIATSTGSSAVPGVVRVPLPYHLRPGQIARVLQKSSTGVTSELSDPVIVENNYVTQDYDNARTGLNPFETILTKSNVPNLKLLFTQVVDVDTTNYPNDPLATEVHAQPLYVHHVVVPERGEHNIVFVAAENNRVFAFDADHNRGTNSHPLWARSLIGQGERSITNFGACNLQRGITSTPVIDRTTNTLYVVGLVDAGGPKWRIHALDISTGEDKKDGHGQPIPAKEIGALGFLPLFQLNRAGLLLDHGVLYVAFGSHCFDDRPDPRIGFYHGWIMAYDADIPGSPTFLDQLGVFKTTEDPTQDCAGSGFGGGIWQSGIGPAADEAGSVYFATGNGPFSKSLKNFGNSVLKVRLSNAGAFPRQMVVEDFFAPTNWREYCNGDQDLGSGGAMLLPDQPQTPTHLLLARGKLGTIYLINRDDMGKDTGHVQGTVPPNGLPTGVNQFHGQPAYYRGNNGQFVFYPTNRGAIKRYKLANASLIDPGISGISSDTFVGVPILTVSSNRTKPGTGVLWGVPPASSLNQIPGMNLYAYDVEDLRQHLFIPLDVGPWPGTSNPFTVPTVIHGKVYVATNGQLAVFGLADEEEEEEEEME